MLFALRMMRNEIWSTSLKNRQKIGTEKVGVDFSEGRGDALRRMAENPENDTRFCGG